MAEGDHGLPASVLAELEEALAAATPGTWAAVSADRMFGDDFIIVGNREAHNGETDVALIFGGKITGRTRANAGLIALARNHLPALLAENKRMREARDFVGVVARMTADGESEALDALIEVARDIEAHADLGATHDQ